MKLSFGSEWRLKRSSHNRMGRKNPKSRRSISSGALAQTDKRYYRRGSVDVIVTLCRGTHVGAVLMCTRGLARQALRGHAVDVIMTLCRRIADV